MEKFKISAQDHIINDILEAFNNSVIGMGLAVDWECEILSECSIEFTLKEGAELKLADIFWFGYISSID